MINLKNSLKRMTWNVVIYLTFIFLSIIRHMHDCDSILEGEKHGPVDFYNCCDL